MPNILHSRKYYINSADRVSGSNQSFKYSFIIPPDHEFDHICVIDASIPMSFYIVRAPYNHFILNEDMLSVKIIITPANYNALTFNSQVVSQLNTNSPNGYTYAMTFDYTKAKYTYTVSGNSGIQPSFTFDDHLVSQTGFSENSINSFVSDTLVSTDVISFVATQSLFIHSDVISDNNNILVDIYCNNQPPYSYLTYQCFNVEHYSKRLSTSSNPVIEFSLLDISGNEVDLNGVDFNFSVMLYKKDNTADMLKRLLNLVSLWSDWLSSKLMSPPPISESDTVTPPVVDVAPESDNAKIVPPQK
jgi:hypothetical protein